MVNTIVICPNCGKNTPEGKFCESCGASLQSVQVQAPSSGYSPPVIPPQPPQAKQGMSALKMILIIGVIFFCILFSLVIIVFIGSTTPAPPLNPITVTITQKVTVTPTKTVLFSDDLSQWRSGWTSESDTDKGKTFYSGGSLHIRDLNPPTGARYHTLNKNFNDFILDVDTKLVDGTIENWQGVDIRNQDSDNYYSFIISADGYYDILKWENGNRIDLIGSKVPSSSYINTGLGATNHIHIEANKNTLSLSVNGQHLKTVTDNSFREGTVDLKVTSMPSNSFSEVVFNNLIITTI